MAEVKGLVGENAPSNDMSWNCPQSLVASEAGIEGISDRAMYAGDALVRRATSLQNVSKAHEIAIRINKAVAASAGLNAGEQVMAKAEKMELTLPVVIDERVPDGSVLIPSLLAGGENKDGVTLSRV